MNPHEHFSVILTFKIIYINQEFRISCNLTMEFPLIAKTAEDDQFHDIASSKLFLERKIAGLSVCYACTAVDYAEPIFFEKSDRFDGIILPPLQFLKKDENMVKIYSHPPFYRLIQ